MALLVGGVILTAGAGALAHLVDRSTVPSEHVDIPATATRRTVAGWLAAAYAGAGTAFTAHDNQLIFHTRSGEPWVAGDARIRIRIRRDSVGMAEGLVADVEPLRGAERRSVILVPDAVSLDMRFLAAGSVSSEWQMQWNAPAEVPRAVALRIVLEAGSESAGIHRLPIIAVIERSR